MLLRIGLVLILGMGFLTLPLASKAHAEGGASKDDNPMFLKLQEMQVPIIQRRKVKGVVVVNITLDLGTGESRKKMEEYLPLIQDKIYWTLYRILGIIWSPDFKLDAMGFKKNIMAELRKQFEEKDIKDILIGDIREIDRSDKQKI